jgi:hypothetical protein
VIDRYAIGQTPHGPVRTVIVSQEPTGEPVSLWLSSTNLLSLFAQHQPQPGERIGVRYRWRDPDNGYSRWLLSVDRREPLDFSPLGGEASDEAPWHRTKSLIVERLERADAIVLKESPHLQVIERFCTIWRRRATYHRLVTALASVKRALCL